MRASRTTELNRDEMTRQHTLSILHPTHPSQTPRTTELPTPWSASLRPQYYHHLPTILEISDDEIHDLEISDDENAADDEPVSSAAFDEDECYRVRGERTAGIGGN